MGAVFVVFSLRSNTKRLGTSRSRHTRNLSFKRGYFVQYGFQQHELAPAMRAGYRLILDFFSAVRTLHYVATMSRNVKTGKERVASIQELPRRPLLGHSAPDLKSSRKLRGREGMRKEGRGDESPALKVTNY